MQEYHYVMENVNTKYNYLYSDEKNTKSSVNLVDLFKMVGEVDNGTS